MKSFLDTTWTLIHFGFNRISRKRLSLSEEKTTQLETWAKKLLASRFTTQDELEIFVGAFISTTPAV